MSRAARRVRSARRQAPSSPAVAPMPFQRECVLKALDQLTDEDRLVLALQLCDGLPDEETAAALGLTVRTMRRTRERVLLLVRRALLGLPFRGRTATPRVAIRSAA